MATLKLIHAEDDARVARLSAIAAASNISLKTEVGKCRCDCVLPCLVTPSGCISHCNAIARHLARMRPTCGLYGRTLCESGKVDSWMEYISNDLEVPASCLCDSQCACKAKEDVAKVLTVLDKHLTHETFLASRDISIADITAASILVNVFKTTPQLAQKLLTLKSLKRWMTTLESQKYFMCKSGGKGDCKKECQKAEKKVEKKEEEPEKPKKRVNPLDSLPPSKLIGDEWKRKYSNSKDLQGDAMPWFWEHFDAAGWSLWDMKYNKLPDECKVPFLTSNMVGGFLQRIDPEFRKHSFGVINILEDKTGGYNIRGIWLFRGTELPFEMTDHVSYDSHTFTKLDHNTDKKTIADFWCSDDMFNGLKVEDCKVWK